MSLAELPLAPAIMEQVEDFLLLEEDEELDSRARTPPGSDCRSLPAI